MTATMTGSPWRAGARALARIWGSGELAVESTVDGWLVSDGCVLRVYPHDRVEAVALTAWCDAHGGGVGPRRVRVWRHGPLDMAPVTDRPMRHSMTRVVDDAVARGGVVPDGWTDATIDGWRVLCARDADGELLAAYDPRRLGIVLSHSLVVSSTTAPAVAYDVTGRVCGVIAPVSLRGWDGMPLEVVPV